MINGDDVVFKTTRRGHSLWERITSYGGLSSSLGKTFLTRAFAQINSVNFMRLAEPIYETIAGKRRALHFTLTPYINLGLLFGLKRSGDKLGLDAVADAEYSTLGERARSLIRCCPQDMRESVMRMFLRTHRTVLDECKLPWFIPEQWGGVGLPTVVQASDVPHDYEPGDVITPFWGPSRLDLQIAARLREAPRKKEVVEDATCATGVRVILGRPLYPVGRSPIEAPWDIHKLVLSRLPVQLSYGQVSSSERRAWETTYGALVFDLFMTDLALMTEKTGLGACRVLRQNQRSWQAAQRAGKLPPPVALSTLLLTHPPQAYLPASVLSMYKTPGQHVAPPQVDDEFPRHHGHRPDALW
jgi:CheY-like chemotaxis protein